LIVSGGFGVEYGGMVPILAKPRLASSSLLPVDVFRNVLEAAVAFDSRSGLVTKNGTLFSLGVATAGPQTASGLSFVETTAQARLYWTPLWDITLRSNTSLGFITNPFGDDAPVTDRYYLGGNGSLRGFFPRSIGPTSIVKTAAGNDADVEVGGTVRATETVELDVPLWPQSPIRAFAFLDVGNAFDGQDFSDLRANKALARGVPLWAGALFASTGVGLRLDNVVAPLRVEWAFPLTRRSFDQSRTFFFGLGSSF
jgi:outer membrane protein insertion porin family